MEGISIETSLLDIKDGIDKIIASGEPCDVNEVIDKIDLFQQDPEVLDRELNGLIKKLTTGFFQLEVMIRKFILQAYSILCQRYAM